MEISMAKLIAMIKALGDGGGGGGGVSDVKVNGTSIVNAQGVANFQPDTMDIVVNVSGATPTISAVSGTRYICGEVSTIDITVPETGIIDVIFESGSTPAVLTVTPPTGVTVVWPDWFDPTALEANKVYEVNIANGRLATVMVW